MGFFVWLVWSLEGLTATFEKYGQYPKLEIHPPKRLEKVLGKEHTKLYSKGLTSRHHGYGIGAHAYFRRIVEETTDDMLDAVVAAMEEAGANATDTEKVRQIKKGNTYEDKVRLVAGILPRVLRPGDANPFAILHELLSKGLHSLTDEECLEIVDGMNKILEYIFVELKAHTTERKAFASGLHALQKKLRNKKTS